MDIFINTDKSPALVQAKATGSPLSAFKVKRGAIVLLSVRRDGARGLAGVRVERAGTCEVVLGGAWDCRLGWSDCHGVSVSLC